MRKDRPDRLLEETSTPTFGNTYAVCQFTHVAWCAACGTQQRDKISIHSFELLEIREGAVVTDSSSQVGVGEEGKSNSTSHFSLSSCSS